ncbi:MAG TPA: ankyrin repeat domain-containing protein [Candidatus Dependentiae bacterium]|nr:ankyrin repeat domain-containing protein [Candidatus Dependentiae bacterium]
MRVKHVIHCTLFFFLCCVHTQHVDAVNLSQFFTRQCSTIIQTCIQTIRHHPKIATSIVAGVCTSYFLHRVKHCFVHKCALYGRSWQYGFWRLLGGRLDKDSREARVAFFKNVARNKVWLVRHMLNDGIDVQDTHILAGEQSALHEATRLGYISMAEILIHNGADIHATNALGQIPLHIAAELSPWPDIQRNRIAIARRLLAQGTLSLYKDKQDRTPLDIARANGNGDMIQLLGYEQ